MIPTLGAVLYLEQPHPRILRRREHHVPERPGQHVLAAGAGDQVSAVFEQLQPPQIDLLVSPFGSLQIMARFGKGRGIQNYYVILRPRRALLLEEIKGIGRHKIHLIKPVQRRISRAHWQANSEISTPVTCRAPNLAACRAKDPVWVKQSSTSAPFTKGAMAARFSF